MKILWKIVIPVYCVIPYKYLKEKKKEAQIENGTKEKERKKKKKASQANYKTALF